MIFFDVTIQELLYLLLIVLVLTLILIMIALFFVIYSYKKLQDFTKWSLIIDQKITNVIVDSEDFADNNFDSYVKKSSFKSYFLDKLVHSNNNFSGSAKEEIHQLFIEYKLFNEALANLKHKKSYRIANGIQKLTAMNMIEYIKPIQTFLTHKNILVRQEAQYAMVSFNGFDGLTFLNDTPYILSDWQQLRLMRSIKKIPENYEASISSWLKSNNPSTVIFTLRLIKEFQLLVFYDTIREMFDNSTLPIRLQIINTLQSLENQNTLDDFINIFDTQPEEVQLEIIKALKLSKDKISKDFFLKQLLNHESSRIKVVAAKALVYIQCKEELLKLVNTDDSPEQVRLIIKHALQEKI